MAVAFQTVQTGFRASLGEPDGTRFPFKNGGVKLVPASTGRGKLAAIATARGSCPDDEDIVINAPATLRPPGVSSEQDADHYRPWHWRTLNIRAPDVIPAVGRPCAAVNGGSSRPSTPERQVSGSSASGFVSSRPRRTLASRAGSRSPSKRSASFGKADMDEEDEDQDPLPYVYAATADLLATCAITEQNRRMRGAIEAPTPAAKPAHARAYPLPADGVGRAGRAAKEKRAAESRRTAETAAHFQQAALDVVAPGTSAAEAVACATQEENESLQLALQGLVSARCMEANANKQQEEMEWRKERTRCAISVQRLWRGRRIRDMMHLLKAEVHRRREVERLRCHKNLRRQRPVRLVCGGRILNPSGSEYVTGERRPRRQHATDHDINMSADDVQQARVKGKPRGGMAHIKIPVNDVLERMIEKQAETRLSHVGDMSSCSSDEDGSSSRHVRGASAGESSRAADSPHGPRPLSQLGSEDGDSPRESDTESLPDSDVGEAPISLPKLDAGSIPPALRASLELLPLLKMSGVLISARSHASKAAPAQDAALSLPVNGKATSEKSSVRRALASAPSSLPSPTAGRDPLDVTNIELGNLRPVFSDQAAVTLRDAMLRDIRYNRGSPAGIALLASRDNIRNRYMMSCRYWHVKPNSLVLSRLVQPAVDEQNLGQRSFYYDFGCANVGDRGVVCVLQALAEDPGCSRVSLRACGLHGASAPVISAFLELHCGLRHMDLSSNSISFEAGEMILESLQRRSRGTSFVGGEWFSPAKPATFRLAEATVDLGGTYLDSVRGPTAGPPCGSYWADTSGNQLRGRLHVAPEDYARLGEQLEGTSKVQYGGGPPRSRSPSMPPSPRESRRASLAT